MAEHSPVQSLDRAFDLLEILCRSRGGMTIGALSAETGLHKSTVHRLLTSMCMRGYVQRDAETSMYRAGMRLCEMSSYIVDNLDVVDRARAVLERLGRETDETVHLVMRDERDVVYIHKIDGGNSAIRMFSRIGMRLPLYCTGVGKAILATWPRSEARAVWGSERRLRMDGEYDYRRGSVFPRDRQGAPARIRARQRGERGGCPLHRGGDTGLPRPGILCDLAVRADRPYGRRAHHAAARSAAAREPRHRAGARRQHGTLTRGWPAQGEPADEVHPVKPEYSPNIDIAARLL